MTPGRWQETALAFDCRGQQLVGVLAQPAGEAASDAGVLIVTGGPQYRAGAHRMFVKLSRALAGAGHAALRFDLRGMGDSEGDFPGFESITPDIGTAVDALLAAAPQVRRVLLWGLCDGASAALLYLHETRDARVRGLCLLNPWVRSQQSLARTHVKHYYARRLLQREFWLKLLRGGIGVQALHGLAANVRSALGRQPAAGEPGAPATFQQRMAQAWRGFDGEIQLLLSGREDITAREFLEHAATDAAWRGLLERAGLQRTDCATADHTFSSAEAAAWLLQRTLGWVQAMGAAPPAAIEAQPSRRAPLSTA
jgi:exosortase A-associated hydrolase 1